MDVIEVGRPGGDEPRRARGGGGRGLAFGAAAVLVLGAVGYGATRPAHHAPPPPPSPTPAALGTSTPSASPSPSPTPTPRPLTARTGLTLAGPNDGLLVYDLDTRRIGPGLAIPGDSLQAVEPIAAIPGGFLVGRWPGCVDEQCGAATFYAVVGGQVTRVGEGNVARTDPDGRTFWLTTGDGTLEHRTFGGQRVRAPFRLHPVEALVGVTADGPVVGTWGMASAIAVLDPATGRRRVVTAHGFPLAAAGRAVAWLDEECPPQKGKDCNVWFSNSHTLDGASVGPVSPATAFAELDRAGRHLAIRVAPGEVTVIDADVVGHVFGIGGTVTLPSAPRWFGWSPDGRWLVLAQALTHDGINDGQAVFVWNHDAGLATAGTYPGADGEQFAVGPARAPR